MALEDHPKHILIISQLKDKLSHKVEFDGSKAAFCIGNGETNDQNVIHEERFRGTQLVLICKDQKYFLKDCGQVLHMCTKLDLKKQVRLHEGAVIDFGNDVRYHCTKCLIPTPDQFGQVEPVFEAAYIKKGSQ